MPTHEQMKIGDVEIDVGMELLLRACWKLGIETHMSCEGGDTRKETIINENGFCLWEEGDITPMWVSFNEARHIERFVEIAERGIRAVDQWLSEEWKFRIAPGHKGGFQYDIWIPATQKRLIEKIFSKEAIL